VSELPPAPLSCSLDRTALAGQLARYRTVGAGARVVGDERECCPFFQIHWDAEWRQLTVAVRSRSEAPALDAIRDALHVP
jgi:hypothetical protein